MAKLDSWDSGKDPYCKVGYARLLVVKHNRERNNLYGELDDCTHIVHVETFSTSLACSAKDGSWLNRSQPSPRWLDDAIDSIDHKINHMLKDNHNGIYEVYGEVYTWSSSSHGGDWDDDSELRNVEIIEISFDDAMVFKPEDLIDDLVSLGKEINHSMFYFNDTHISHYMPRQEILMRRILALTALTTMHAPQKHTYEKMTEEELDNLAYMLTIDLSAQNIERAEKINAMTVEVLARHDKIMKQSSD